MKEKENGSKKTIFSIIIGFIIGLFTFVLPKLCNFRKPADTIGDNDRQSAELTERVGREIEDLGNRTEQSKSDYSAAKQTIAEIRKNQKVDDRNIDSFNYCECGFDNDDGPDAA